MLNKMLPWLIGAAIAAVVVVALWDEIISWLKDLVYRLREAFRELKTNIMHACAVFAKRVGEAMTAISHKVYYKENRQWMEKTTTRKIQESELPESILNKLFGQREEDITTEMENELGLEI